MRVHHRLKAPVNGDEFFKFGNDDNRSVPDQENTVDGACFQIRIPVHQTVEHVTCEQVHCHVCHRRVFDGAVKTVLLYRWRKTARLLKLCIDKGIDYV
jgi:hypothetical protein